MIDSVNESMNVFEIIEYQSEFLNLIIRILNSKIILLINKIHEKFGKFYLRTITGDADYIDYETLKDDMQFLKLVDKIEKLNSEIITLVSEEQIIGEFHDLKYYLIK
jgi:hypothetical protein